MLLHDAPEYVIGDMISPFKTVIGDAYKAVEQRLLAAIHLRFGLPAALPRDLVDLIKAADRVAAYLEATRLAGFAAGRSAPVLRQAAGAAGAHRARLSRALAGRTTRRRAISTALPRSPNSAVAYRSRDTFPYIPGVNRTKGFSFHE